MLAEINVKQTEKTTEEEDEMSTEDFAQLSREDQLKVHTFKIKTQHSFGSDSISIKLSQFHFDY